MGGANSDRWDRSIVGKSHIVPRGGDVLDESRTLRNHVTGSTGICDRHGAALEVLGNEGPDRGGVH